MDKVAHAVEIIFQATVKDAPTPIMVCGVDGTILKVNPAWERVWEVPHEVLESAEFKKRSNLLNDPNMRSTGLQERLANCLKGEHIPPFEFFLDPKKVGRVGRANWSEIHLSALKDPEGNIFGALIIFIDLNERKAQEASLREREAKLIEANARTNLVLDNTEMILFSFDKNGIFTYSEGRGLRTLGLQNGQVVGLSALDLYAGDAPVLAAIKNSLLGLEQKLNTKHAGSYFEIQLTPHFNSNKTLAGVTGVAIDITERITAVEALRETQSYLATVLESAPIALYATDVSGKITLLEGSALRTIGVQPSEVLGKNFKDVFGSLAGVPENWDKAIRGEARNLEIQFGERVFDGYMAPMRNAALEITGMVGVSVDITARKTLSAERNEALAREKAAVEASTMKSTFLANMSHEIRTPINGFLGLTELLLETKLSDSQRSLADSAKNSAEILLTLINDILDLSRAEAGRIDIEAIDFDLSSVFNDIEMTLNASAKKKSLRFLNSIAAGTPTFVKGDPTRLRQVLMNLVGNALKFTESGEVRFGVRAVDSVLRFEVHDTGIGMSREELGKIFLPFSQVDYSTTRRFGGSGLGLSIVRYLVRLMGGEIGVDSRAGQGSCFWFTLPLVLGAETVPLRGERAPVVESVRGLQILVAEDNVTNQIVIRGMLQRLGHVVSIVADGRAALEAASASRFDLIVMDCQMPDLDGYEATRAIRLLEKTSGLYVPIIALTASAMSGDREKALAAGMSHYLAKPVKLRSLEGAIAAVLGSARGVG